MIDRCAAETADSFARGFSELLRWERRFALDGTWPSVGTVDKLLFSLRGKEQFDEADRILLEGAAAYLGVIACNCWNQMPGVKAELIPGEAGELLLRASGGPHPASGESVEIDIAATLSEILAAPSPRFPAFGRNRRERGPDENLIGLFAAGLVSGLSPFAKGNWKRCSITEFAPNLEAVCRYLAPGCARFYEAVNPTEPTGAAAELYYPHLILPPSGCEEREWAVRGVARLCDHCRWAELTEGQLAAVAANLALFPEELLSQVGLAVSIAQAGEELPVRLRAAASSVGPALQKLRPAVLISGRMLGKTVDCEAAMQAGNWPEAARLYWREYRFGLIPHLYLPDLSLIGEPLLAAFFYLLGCEREELALEVLETYEQFEPAPASLLLQRCYLELELQKFDRAAETLERSRALDGDREHRFRALCLAARIDQAYGRRDRARKRLEDALQLGSADTRRYCEAGTALSLCQFVDGDCEAALKTAEAVLSRDEGFNPARYRQLIALAVLDRDQELLEAVNRARLYAVSDYRIFSFLRDYECRERVGG